MIVSEEKHTNNIYVVVHGPYAGNAYQEIFHSLLPRREQIKQIIVSSYIGQKEQTEAALNQYRKSFDIKTMYSKDLINPGYFNFNRQVLTVRAALHVIKDDAAYVVKLRNDQWFDANRFFDLVSNQCLNGRGHKILTTNCFTRKDRWYHPSDMFLCGFLEDIKDYYSVPFQTQTHLNIQMEMIEKLKYSHEEFNCFLVSPESELFKH